MKVLKWGILAGAILAVAVVRASDLTTGYTFTDGQTVYAANLNAAVNNAVISPAFITGKSALATLGYQPSENFNWTLNLTYSDLFRDFTGEKIFQCFSMEKFCRNLPS